VRRLMGLKLFEDLGLVSQISKHVLVSRFVIFHILNKQKNIKNAKIAKIPVLQNLLFLCRAESDWSETWLGHWNKY
jgi:hypothetical protein